MQPFLLDVLYNLKEYMEIRLLLTAFSNIWFLCSAQTVEMIFRYSSKHNEYLLANLWDIYEMIL